MQFSNSLIQELFITLISFKKFPLKQIKLDEQLEVATLSSHLHGVDV